MGRFTGVSIACLQTLQLQTWDEGAFHFSFLDFSVYQQSIFGMDLLFFLYDYNIAIRVFSFPIHSFHFHFQSSNMPLSCLSLCLLVIAGQHGQCSGHEVDDHLGSEHDEVGGHHGDVHDEAGGLLSNVHDGQGGPLGEVHDGQGVGEDHLGRVIDVGGFIEDVVTKHKRDIGGLNRDNDGLKKDVVIKHRHRPSVHKSYGSGSYVIPEAALRPRVETIYQGVDESGEYFGDERFEASDDVGEDGTFDADYYKDYNRRGTEDFKVQFSEDYSQDNEFDSTGLFHSYDYLTDQSANSDFEDWDTNIVTENQLYNIPESTSGEELWSSEKETERVEEAAFGKRTGRKEP